MAFDPSVISSIPDSSINPIEAKAKGYTLASLIDDQKLGRMKVNAAQSEQADMGKIKDILGKSDISTFEGQNKAAEAAMKVSPKLGMDLQRGFAQKQSAQYEKQDSDLRMYAVQQDHIAGALDSVLAEADQLRKSGATDAMVNATIMRSVLGAKESLQRQMLPNGQPVWNQQLDKALAGGPLTYDRIKSLEMQSNKGQELIKQRLAERHQGVTEAQENERERHDRATESNATRKTDASVDGGFSGPAGELMAALSERGVSLPAGFRSKAQQKATLDSILKRNEGQTADQIADKIKAGQIDFTAAKTEANVVARREGSSAAAISALNSQGGLYDQLLETGRKIDFGSAKFKNSFELWKAGEVVADPDISEYVNALADTRAEFASVLARGGQVTDSVRIASEHAFPDKMSLGELERNIGRSKKIAQAIQAGNTSVADAIARGKDLNEALKSTKTDAPKPYDDADKEARYQAWKKAHGG
jgi:hypothetical protein